MKLRAELNGEVERRTVSLGQSLESDHKESLAVELKVYPGGTVKPRAELNGEVSCRTER